MRPFALTFKVLNIKYALNFYVTNACQITADAKEDIRPFALMMEECRELYALLSAPHE